MTSTKIVVIGLLAALGCGSSESSSSFTSCGQDSSCRAGVCRLVEECLIDECEAELTYEFAGEEFESTCIYGPATTTTIYPLDGGAGSTKIESNLKKCFYEAEVEFYDFDEEQKCTVLRECTLQQLSCEPATAGHPNCSVVSESPC
jgi:hypothetical protein